MILHKNQSMHTWRSTTYKKHSTQKTPMAKATRFAGLSPLGSPGSDVHTLAMIWMSICSIARMTYESQW